MARILIIDDEFSNRLVLKKFLESAGLESLEADSGNAGLEVLEREDVDLVLLDVMMPGISGMDTLKQIKEQSPRLPVILVTSDDRVDQAIEAIGEDAYDYLTKPVTKEGLLEVANSALEAVRGMAAPVDFAALEESEEPSEDRIVGRSPKMWEIYKQIGRVARTDATVLVTGESGTGKELAARAIYFHSLRKDKVFLTINCAALTETLLESELFGHEKGAFTGATSSHPGKFEQADGGTLFLDEIGDMSASTQAKILRTIQQKTFQRVGATETLSYDVRVIAATN
jgi:DNA-binding NtrC family response regulator